VELMTTGTSTRSPEEARTAAPGSPPAPATPQG
jgi:hypothetical protein